MSYKILYKLAQQAFFLLLLVLRFFHSKTARMLAGRKHTMQAIRVFREKFPEDKLFWFHAASVGEFEQAVPVIRILKEKYPDLRIVASFFSPSGMEQKGNHPLLDLSFYLPGDSEKGMQNLLVCLRPAALIIVKYEFWYHLLLSCRQNQIPLISICCILREKSFRQIFLSTHLKNCLPMFSRIFVQNSETARLLQNLNLNNFRISGDTRIDRVLEIREKPGEISWLPAWKEGHKLLIIGSAWTEDLVYLKEFIRHAVLETDGLWRVLIVPHEIRDAQIQQLISSLGFPMQRFSSWQPESNCDILLLDKVGMLSFAYRYADAAWIGGGFRTGLHNVLEAAVYKIPVGFGPKYAKFREAADLIAIGIARSFPSGGSVWEFFQRSTEPSEENEIQKQAAENYFQSQKGAAAEIAQYLLEL